MTSCKGRDQLSWILGEDESLLNRCCSRDLLVKPFFLECFSDSTKQWKQSLEAVDAAINAGPEHNGLIASVLLLNTLSTPPGTFTCQKAIVEAQEKLLLIIDGSFLFHFIFTHDSEVEDQAAEDNLDFIRHLQKLDSIIQSFSKRRKILELENLEQVHDAAAAAKKIDADKNIESAKNDQISNKYDHVFKDVPLGDDWIKEFVMFTYDVPLSKNFAVTSYSAFVERYKRILMAHDGFKDLSYNDQVRISGTFFSGSGYFGF